ncbi:MAG: hypothetical protein QOF45_596 [Gaiellaceae bacterium]|jgi:2-keto-4-pentenoate hydratase|nr:hypothetical protein [Gaiellaceae bacterium]
MTSLDASPLVLKGMEEQLALRRRLLAEGAIAIGWKLGLGSPDAMETFGTTAPLVGFLTDRSVLEQRATCSIGDWVNPAAEAEIAVHLAHDVQPDASPAAAAAAISGLGAAIELVDVDVPMEDVAPILAGDLFHRHVMLGPARPHNEEIHAQIFVNGEDREAIADPLAVVGDPIASVCHVARFLARFGERLRAGEVIITGSIVPLMFVTPGDRIEYHLTPLGALTVDFTV